jgi:lytic murein transglycosylase
MRVVPIFLPLVLGLLAFPAPGLAQDRAAVERQFAVWKENVIWPAARSRGISRRSFDASLGSVVPDWDLPGLVPPGSDTTPRRQTQAEFGSPQRYFSENVLAPTIAGGRQRLFAHKALLARLEQRTGVPGHIIIAIWGRESGFGRAAIPHPAFRVLATKAFMSTRPQLFTGELLAALEMVEKRGIDPARMKSSWAGALGQPQFLPSSYLEHASDGDGDGIADIWNSQADTLASIAGYLGHHAWVRGRDWGFEVDVPASIPCHLEGPDRGRRIDEWTAMGIRRVSGRPFPEHERRKMGYLLMPAGRLGPAFIVTPNFYVLKEYNESDVYALFVGHAGDRMAYGGQPFSGDWKRIETLLRSDIAAMQRRMEKLGYDVGGADGLPGYKTRRSIGEWQAENAMAPTCFPDSRLVGAIR